LSTVDKPLLNKTEKPEKRATELAHDTRKELAKELGMK